MRVRCLGLIEIDTVIWDKLLHGGGASGANTVDPKARAALSVPVGKVGQAADIAWLRERVG